jgi:hypothetical protein
MLRLLARPNQLESKFDTSMLLESCPSQKFGDDVVAWNQIDGSQYRKGPRSLVANRRRILNALGDWSMGALLISVMKSVVMRRKPA